MNYEQKYEEMLEHARIEVLAHPECRKIWEDIFPELRESEDERIRRAVIKMMKVPRKEVFEMEGITKEQALAWLEKQKDADKAVRAVEMIERYITERTANAHDMADANPMKQYYTGVDATLSSISGILQDVYAEKQKGKKPAELDKLRKDLYQSGYNDGYKHGKEDAQKEQKPVEYIDKDKVYAIMNKLHNLAFSQLIPINSDEYKKIAEITGDVRRLLDYPIEQKPNIELIQRSWYMEGYHDGEFKREPKWILKTGESGPRHELNPRYGEPLAEQKPAEKQDYSGLNDLERAIHRGFLCAGVDNAPVTIIKETAQDCLAQIKPAEWSEEDKYILEDAITAIDMHLTDEFKEIHPNLFKAFLVAKDFLKSLRPQPMQEWGEEDEKTLNRIVFNLETHCPITPIEQINWLKSLHRRFSLSSWGEEIRDAFFGVETHWKPSEEQLDTLKEIINQDCTVCNGDRKWIKPNLESLYEQLKAL